MLISIKDLKSGFDKIFDELLENGHEKVEVNHDLYWNIDEDERYDIKSNPQRLDIGQLTDDYEELRKINSGESDPISFSLVWLSALARAVGESKVL